MGSDDEDYRDDADEHEDSDRAPSISARNNNSSSNSSSYSFLTPNMKARPSLGGRPRLSMNGGSMGMKSPALSMMFTQPARTTATAAAASPSSQNFAETMRKRKAAAQQQWSAQSRGATNTAALMSNRLNLRREPVMPELTVTGAEAIVTEQSKRFLAPRSDSSSMSDAAIELTTNRAVVGRRLGVRMRAYTGAMPAFKPMLDDDNDTSAAIAAAAPSLPTTAAATAAIDDDFQPLILWQPTAVELEHNPLLSPTGIVVDEFLARRLRPHQREGVAFMADCVLGLKAFHGNGCILADDMGLGKTCMSVALLYTLLRHGMTTTAATATAAAAVVTTCKRVIVICPTSLVSNWKNEVHKWVGDALTVIALAGGGKAQCDRGIDEFIRPYNNSNNKSKLAHVLVLSYDTYRRRYRKFVNQPHCCDLLICDEAHRLKNNNTSIYSTLNAMPCARRVLLTGTPLQNDLSEFYAMIDFINPKLLGTQQQFHAYYEAPILAGREPDAYEHEQQQGNSRSIELSAIVNQFVLRRTNVLLSKHLPSKVMQVICCRASALQQKIYDALSKSKAIRALMQHGSNNSDDDDDNKSNARDSKQRTAVLPLINTLKQLCNHPKLVYDQLKPTDADYKQQLQLFPAAFRADPCNTLWGGKMHVLLQLLLAVKHHSPDDRFVIVSNYTTTLDLIATLCQQQQWQSLRLDGSTPTHKRQPLVDALGSRSNSVYVFLLSSKAGGCGLNMIGANRLVLFDPDWNPAVDKQAAARVWRDGQTKRCFLYRLLTTGSIEEKIYQRQLMKEGLQAAAMSGSSSSSSGLNDDDDDDAAAAAASTIVTNNVSSEELRDLFDLKDSSAVPFSDTHDTLECSCCDQLLRVIDGSSSSGNNNGGDGAVRKRERKFRVRKEKKVKAVVVAQSKKGKGKKQQESNSSSSSSSSNSSSGSDSDNEPIGDTDATMTAADGSKDSALQDAEAVSSTTAEDTATTNTTTAATSSISSSSSSYLAPKKRSQAMRLQRGEPLEDKLSSWAHHSTVLSTPDPMLRRAFMALRFEETKTVTTAAAATETAATPDAAAITPTATTTTADDGTVVTILAATGTTAAAAAPPAAYNKLWVSFVFSCELQGKPLSVDKEMEAQRVTACMPADEAEIEAEAIAAIAAASRKKSKSSSSSSSSGKPTAVIAGAPMTAAEASAKHAAYIDSVTNRKSKAQQATEARELKQQQKADAVSSKSNSSNKKKASKHVSSSEDDERSSSSDDDVDDRNKENRNNQSCSNNNNKNNSSSSDSNADDSDDVQEIDEPARNKSSNNGSSGSKEVSSKAAAITAAASPQQPTAKPQLAASQQQQQRKQSKRIVESDCESDSSDDFEKVVKVAPKSSNGNNSNISSRNNSKTVAAVQSRPDKTKAVAAKPEPQAASSSSSSSKNKKQTPAAASALATLLSQHRKDADVVFDVNVMAAAGYINVAELKRFTKMQRDDRQMMALSFTFDVKEMWLNDAKQEAATIAATPAITTATTIDAT